MKSANGCPFCQEYVINVVASKRPAIQGYQFQCDNCGACGPIYDNEEDALMGWEEGIKSINGRMRKNN
jgi:hypothetical protein